MPHASDFRLYYSNALDVLAQLLASELRTPASGQPLLAPDVVLIPQVAMRRWLQATLAQVHGIAANLEFLTPGEFVRRALDANVPGADEELDAAVLHWRLHAALSDPALRAQPALASLDAFLVDGDPVKAWSLAGELAAVFEKYQAWRRDWLLRWDGGSDADDPQAILWRAVAGNRAHRARRIQQYLARFGDGDTLPAGLPPRLFAFATLNVSPDVLRVLATQARVGALHFYLPTPACGPWGDLRPRRAQVDADAADDNPLLRDWGAAGRDFMALLDSYEVVHPRGEIDACVDPDTRAAEGGVPDRLLQRLQADLFHRRARPAAALRAAVDADDPSLQLHACHTRLREVQVLHDRLRALLEDPRFDPPLQPREIAVLAPDIDPYLPYLDAVFAGHGQGDAIPYAVADASPLAGEPLADVFLRLLALPVARFGLEETLDLLASPPLAEAAGLTAVDFERLHDWLHAAGARWGLDAAHRARSGAPADDAYSWQFALDRLVLGHASGSDDDIAGVAPWPELEGSALAALDTLLRLLRVLARHERALGDALVPAQWRERLLGLLDALLPRPPASPTAQRALTRLRRLIDDFAHQAARAGFAAPLPAEAVRSHFATVLAAADTRAPLLTGGVSFARMVPMRLLPFRVICLLGMNDGDFPRRDPAPGLNRLVADLASDRRRHGDRSTRDDDRYLFLQLFAAAQDVFYASWLGADPRDGSAREPSALVTELLTAAVDQHATGDGSERAQQQKDIAGALVLRHPLQPFSPAAFGAGEPRLFSYRGPWRDAAAALSGARAPMAPWMPAGVALPAEDSNRDDGARELPIDALRRFLADPAASFLQQRLDLRLAPIEAAGDDIEPLQGPASGLERYALQHAVFAARLAGDDTAMMQARLRARGLLPSGAAGRRALDAVLHDIAPYVDAYMHWRGDARAMPCLLSADIDGVRLHRHVADALPQGIARLRFGAPNATSAIRNGLDWLLACASDAAPAIVEFHDVAERGVGPHARGRLAPQQAVDALRRLLALRALGLRRPLPFAPRSAWALFNADSVERGLHLAATQWRGSDRTWAEGDAPGWRLALRGRDPFADAATAREFATLAGEVFGLLTQGSAQAYDLAGVALPERDETEDAA